jgi:predicted MFS family arabinose efflux permease
VSNKTNDSSNRKVPFWITLLLAISCGVIVANVYYSQIIVGPISLTTGIPAQAAGLIVTMTQIGYGTGLLFLTPLGDIIENRRLVVVTLLGTALALAAAAWTRQAVPFLAASLFIGLGSAATQILVPYAAHLSPPEIQGRTVGNVMSGLLIGITMARPVSSLITDLFGWPAVFGLSALVIILLAIVLVLALPPRQPSVKLHYPALIRSMGKLLLNTPILRRRAAYQACVFAAFSVFWTTVPLLLSGPVFQLSQREIALFALVGISGALAAPVAGRVADRGLVRPATAVAMGMVLLSMLLPLLIPSHSPVAMPVLVGAAILLNAGVFANQVLGQRTIYALSAEVRSRLNGLYMAMFFAGGAVGSSVGGWAYATGGWSLALYIGTAFTVITLLYFLTEK